MSALPDKQLTLRGIEMFVAVVEEASLGGGARRLGASASAVSQQISNLETALGAKLIDRAARPFALTASGQLFHARAIAILDETARARADLARIERRTFRRLRLAVVDEAETEILPRLLERLAEIYPDCNFVVRSGLSHENLAALESRSVDLVISADTDLMDDGFVRHPVLRDPFLLACAPGLIGADAPLGDLIKKPMVRYGQSQMLGRMIEAHLRRLKLSPPRRFEVSTNAGVLSSVAAVEGWAITTAFAFASCPGIGERLEIRPLPSAGQARSLSVYARAEVMGSLPLQVAAALRILLADTVGKAVARHPWLADTFRVLDRED
ncbi:MAG: LysR family transcriptional regulator [Pseudomonadota bacterium]